ncbi:MAG TPA: glycosyltransferase [Steroidobacteraceae bacterium]|nr:glycosyltransferase [Steroidobacteraceae bacterium]
MKVLWLAHAIPYPPKAGYLSRSYHLLRELTREHRVDLVAFVQEQWLTTLFANRDEGLEESRSALGEFCQSVTFLPIDSVGRFLGKQRTALRALIGSSAYKTYTTSWLQSHSANSVIRRLAHTGGYDLVHVDTIGLAPYRELSPRLPATLTHHNIESHMMLRRADNSGNFVARSYFRTEGRRLRKYEQEAATHFGAHITCSELDADRFREIVPDANIVVVPNGVDCEFFAPRGQQTRPNSIVFVGTMNWYPNVQAVSYLLREVWPVLKSVVPTATLDVAGSNPPDSIVRMARALPDVTIHGYLPDVRPLIDSAAVFACPIQDGGGTKLKILDAFAMEKCVVAHPIACEGIQIVPGHNVVLASSPQQFVAEISSLLADDIRRKALGRAARELVQTQYSYREIGARFRETLEDAARRYSTPH